MIEEAHSVNKSCHCSNCIISANIGEGINIRFFPHELYLQHVENNISKSWNPRQVINLWFQQSEEFKVLARKICKSQLVLALYTINLIKYISRQARQDTVPWTFHRKVLLEGSGAGYCKILQLFRPATARCNQAISWVANVCHFSLVFLVFLPLLWPLFLLVLTWYYDSKLVPAILASQTLWSKKLLLPYLSSDANFSNFVKQEATPPISFGKSLYNPPT